MSGQVWQKIGKPLAVLPAVVAGAILLPVSAVLLPVVLVVALYSPLLIVPLVVLIVPVTLIG